MNNNLNYIGTDWRSMRDNFTVDQLVNLNLRVTKNVKVYSDPSGGVLWDNWTIYANTIAGTCDTWVDGKEFAQYGYVNKDVDGVYLGMKPTAATGNKPYYLKLEGKFIDWEYLKTQIDDNQRAQMSAFQNFVEDLDTKIQDTKTAVSDTLTTAAYWGIGILTTWFVWENVLKPMIYLRTAKSTARDLIKEFKR